MKISPIITQSNLSVEGRNSNPEASRLNTSVAAETGAHPDVLSFQNLNNTSDFQIYSNERAEIPKDDSSTVKQNARKMHSEELKKEVLSLALKYNNKSRAAEEVKKNIYKYNNKRQD